MFTLEPPTNVEAQRDLINQYRPAAGEAFAAGYFGENERTSFGLAASLGDINRAADSGESIDEVAWKESESFRPGLAWKEGMTTSLAEVLAERHDKTQHRALVWERSSWGGKLAMIAGGFIGSIPDPMIFIPILHGTGLGARAATRVGTGAVKMLRRGGKVGGAIADRLGPRAGAIARAAGEGTIGVGLYQPALAYEAGRYQEDFDLRMVGLNLAMGAGIGGGFGALAHSISRLTPEQRLAATAKAASDLIEGLPVDVSEVISNKIAVSGDLKAAVNALPEAPHAKIARKGSKRAAEEPPALAMQSEEGLNIPALAEALDTPRVGRTAAQQELIDGVHLTLPDEMAVKAWAVPHSKRTPEQKAFLEAYKTDTIPEFYQAKIAKTELEIAATEAHLKKTGAPAKIIAQRETLKAKLEATHKEMAEVAAEKTPDNIVAEQPAPVEPKVKPTTKENLRDPVDADIDEADFVVTEARFKELEEEGRLPPEYDDLAKEAKNLGDEADAVADAYEAAGLCLSGKS